MSTILIVDDELAIQRMLSYVLRKDQHSVLTAGSAEEALAKLNSHAVDIVLLDVAMPDIDGIALLQRLRATPDYLELPIVMLTASPDERKRIQAIAAGANAYLNKIASPRELIDTVDALLQKASKSVF